MLNATNAATGYDPRLSSHQRFGAMIERHVLDRLTALGYVADLETDWTSPYDIRLHTDSGILPVEVKSARPTYQRRKGRRPRQRWAFDLTGGLGAGQDYLFVLVQVHDTGEIACYVTPSAYLTGAGRRSVSITSPAASFTGSLKNYLEDWAQIERVSAWRVKYTQIANGQLALF